jgi:hypothetical protein
MPLFAPEPGEDRYYRGGGETAHKIVGYAVEDSVSVTVKGDPEKLKTATSQVIDAALLAGARTLRGPYFTRADTTAETQHAIAEATKNAIGNLQAMAKGMGVTILHVTSASLFGPREEDEYGLGGPGPKAYLRAGGPPVPGVAAPTASVIEVQAEPVTAQVWADAEYALPGG